MVEKVLKDRFSCLDTIPACDRQKNGHVSVAKTALAARHAGKKSVNGTRLYYIKSVKQL